MTNIAPIADQLTAKFKIVTPMFLGGAQHEADGIRPPSIKGVLRFWWRALNWNRFRQEHSDDVRALECLHKEEARLFGAASKLENGKQLGGQGVFLLSAVSRTEPAQLSVKEFTPLSYMLGMGLFEKKALKRDALQGEFDLILRFRSNATSEDRHSVLHALHAFSLLGGLGSRARHGWGSVALLDIQGAVLAIAPDAASYRQQLKTLSAMGTVADNAVELSDAEPSPFGRGQGEGSLIPPHPNLLPKGEGTRRLDSTTLTVAEPPFSAFSALTQLRFTKNAYDSALDVVDALGREMALYRSWGNGKEVFKEPVESNFRADHDLMRDAAANGKKPEHAPERVIFGLPHNYFFSSINDKNKQKVDIQKTSGGRERRASPLLLHIHPVADGYLGVALLLRSRFLPESDQACIKTWEVPIKPAWGRMDEFLKRPVFFQER